MKCFFSRISISINSTTIPYLTLLLTVFQFLPFCSSQSYTLADYSSELLRPTNNTTPTRILFICQSSYPDCCFATTRYNIIQYGIFAGSFPASYVDRIVIQCPSGNCYYFPNDDIADVQSYVLYTNLIHVWLDESTQTKYSMSFDINIFQITQKSTPNVSAIQFTSQFIYFQTDTPSQGQQKEKDSQINENTTDIDNDYQITRELMSPNADNQTPLKGQLLQTQESPQVTHIIYRQSPGYSSSTVLITIGDDCIHWVVVPTNSGGYGEVVILFGSSVIEVYIGTTLKYTYTLQGTISDPSSQIIPSENRTLVKYFDTQQKQLRIMQLSATGTIDFDLLIPFSTPNSINHITVAFLKQLWFQQNNSTIIVSVDQNYFSTVLSTDTSVLIKRENLTLAAYGRNYLEILVIPNVTDTDTTTQSSVSSQGVFELTRGGNLFPSETSTSSQIPNDLCYLRGDKNILVEELQLNMQSIFFYSGRAYETAQLAKFVYFQAKVNNSWLVIQGSRQQFIQSSNGIGGTMLFASTALLTYLYLRGSIWWYFAYLKYQNIKKLQVLVQKQLHTCITPKLFAECYVVHYDKPLGRGAFGVVYECTSTDKIKKFGRKINPKKQQTQNISLELPESDLSRNLINTDHNSDFYSSNRQSRWRTSSNANNIQKESTILNTEQFACKVLSNSAHREEAIASEIAALESVKGCRSAIQMINYSHSTENTFIVLELAEQSLEAYLQKRYEQPFSNEEVLTVALDLIEVLVQLKNNNFTHRDIKPSNILIMPDKTIKMTDFGAAQRHSLSDYTRQNDTLIGSIPWMAPELLSVITGQTDYPSGSSLENNNLPIIEYDKCDIFSLGLTLLYVLLRTPLKQANQYPWVLSGYFKILNTEYSYIHPLFRLMLQKMTVFNPSKRPSCFIIKQHILQILRESKARQGISIKPNHH